MALVSCTECGNKISEKAQSCPKCGAPNEVIICAECTTEVNRDSKTCPNCGIDLVLQEQRPQENTHQDSNSIVQQPTIVRQPTRKKGYGGIIVFGILGVILIVIGMNVQKDMQSFSSDLQHWSNRFQNGGQDPEYEAKKYGSMAALGLGGFFMIISLVKLIKR
jgi:uncharacterized membrane protein YvbJ